VLCGCAELAVRVGSRVYAPPRPLARAPGVRRRRRPVPHFKVPVLREDSAERARLRPVVPGSNTGVLIVARAARVAPVVPGVRVCSGRVERGRAGEAGASGTEEPERGRARPKAVQSARRALRQRTRPGRCFLTADILLAAPPPGICHLRLRRHRRHVP
jgi:hypothetical protein